MLGSSDLSLLEAVNGHILYLSPVSRQASTAAPLHSLFLLGSRPSILDLAGIGVAYVWRYERKLRAIPTPKVENGIMCII